MLRMSNIWWVYTLASENSEDETATNKWSNPARKLGIMNEEKGH